MKRSPRETSVTYPTLSYPLPYPNQSNHTLPCTVNNSDRNLTPTQNLTLPLYLPVPPCTLLCPIQPFSLTSMLFKTTLQHYLPTAGAQRGCHCRRSAASSTTFKGYTRYRKVAQGTTRLPVALYWSQVSMVLYTTCAWNLGSCCQGNWCRWYLYGELSFSVTLQ